VPSRTIPRKGTWQGEYPPPPPASPLAYLHNPMDLDLDMMSKATQQDKAMR
jgi:hypothetical protein